MLPQLPQNKNNIQTPAFQRSTPGTAEPKIAARERAPQTPPSGVCGVVLIGTKPSAEHRRPTPEADTDRKAARSLTPFRKPHGALRMTRAWRPEEG